MTKAMSMTSSQEIDAFEPGDNTIEITAYVDCVEGTKYVGKNNKALFKFIINNGNGRRIRVLLWEQKAKQFDSKIINREIVHIERAMYLPVNQTYFHKEEDLIPYELSLSKNSSIHLLGKYVTDGHKTPEVVATTIQNCSNVEGKICLEGFIKITFAQITTSYSSYGSGAIVQDKYKLRVHINNFRENAALVQGANVKIEGELKRDKYNSIYLHVEDMDDIQIISNKVLTSDELSKGIYAPRKRNVDCVADNDSVAQTTTKRACEFHDSGNISQISSENSE